MDALLVLLIFAAVCAFGYVVGACACAFVIALGRAIVHPDD